MGSLAAAGRVAALVLLAFVLPGCGDDEPAQRKAFIAFLQSRIIDKPGLHVPKLTEEEAKSFGPYAKDYAVIADFNGALDRSIAAPMEQAMRNGAVHAVGDLVTRRADFVAVRDGMAKLRADLDRELATADAAHAALRQPDDLKPVFDQAYDRDVTQPAKAFADVFPDTEEALAAIIALGDFLDQHKAEIRINGAMIETANRALEAQLKTMIAGLSDKNAAIAKAQQRLRAIAGGG